MRYSGGFARLCGAGVRQPLSASAASARWRRRIRQRQRRRHDVLRRRLRRRRFQALLHVAGGVGWKDMLCAGVLVRIRLQQRHVDQLAVEDARIHADIEQRVIDRERLGVVVDGGALMVALLFHQAELEERRRMAGLVVNRAGEGVVRADRGRRATCAPARGCTRPGRSASRR